MDPSSCQPLFLTDLDVLPRHRHAAPSGPWPWMDFSTVDDTTATSGATVIMTDVMTATADCSLWRDYPQNKFQNWTPDQVERSRMLTKCSKNKPSTIYWVDVGDDEKFTTPDMRGDGSTSAFWDILNKERPEGIRVRSLSVDHLTLPVLRMLGTRYTIEPFFFTSSINWIPSRYQETLSHGKEDHITITLPFVRTIPQGSKSQSSESTPTNHIDPQAPLLLHNDNMLCMDLLAIHMVRTEKTSTIISYHPEPTESRLSAKRFHLLMMLIGKSVYWQNIFSKSKDPTFLFLAILWYALYAWDESLESLHTHVSSLVPAILNSPAKHSCDLYSLKARLLHYESLLHDFQVSVSFIEKTPNPAMHCEGIYEEQRKVSNELMKKECGNLLSEIDCLEKRRMMLCDRLKNLLDIVDSMQTKTLIEVTTKDSEAFGKISDLMKQLTEAKVRDSATLSQIEHLTEKLTEVTVTSSATLTQIEHLTKRSTEATIRISDLTKQLTEAKVRGSVAPAQIEHLTKNLTEATVTSSATLTQIEHLTKKSTETMIRNPYLMIFLLASFIAYIFWINAKDINGSESVQTLASIALTSLHSLCRHQTNHTSEIASGWNVTDPFPLKG